MPRAEAARGGRGVAADVRQRRLGGGGASWGGYTNTSGGRRRKGREPPPERCLSRRDLAVHFLDGVDAIRDARRRGLRLSAPPRREETPRSQLRLSAALRSLLLLRRRGRRRRLVDRLAGHALRDRREEGGQLLEQSRLLLGRGYLGRVCAGRRGRFGGRLQPREAAECGRGSRPRRCAALRGGRCLGLCVGRCWRRRRLHRVHLGDLFRGDGELGSLFTAGGVEGRCSHLCRGDGEAPQPRRGCPSSCSS